MDFLKCSVSICSQNMRKWQTDYRVWCIAFLLAVMVAIFTDDLRKVSQLIDEPVPVWIFPFLYSQFHTKLIFLLPLVLLFCNAPFNDKNGTFVFMRSGKTKWLCGQILYIAAASAAYFLFLLIFSFIFTGFGENFGQEWGKLLKTLSNSYSAQFEAGVSFLDISPLVVTFFKPLQATGFTFLMSWLGGVFIGLLIFFLNLVSGTKHLGIFISSLVVVISSAVENDGFEMLIPFSPISWTTLDNIDVGGLTKNPSFAYCICVYAGIIVLLIAAILFFGRKKSIDNGV